MYLREYLKRIPRLSLLSGIAKKHKVSVWLVGGFLRDIYLGRKDFLDFDFCLDKRTAFIAREFAKRVSSKCIVLDDEQASYRVVLKRKGKLYTYDFTRLRAKDLRQDLALRDFSINTLALKLESNAPKSGYKITDYFDARRDIRRKIIRVIKKRVLEDDPLRILRGFSFMANYGFRIETKTLEAMRRCKKFLKRVSGERINEELFRIFEAPFSYKAVNKMDTLRILEEIIPYVDKARGVYQGPYHHLDVWKHSLETLKEFELIYQHNLLKDKDIYDYLEGELASGRKRLSVVKLACLLHDIGKPFAKKEKDKKTIFHTHEKIGRDLTEKVAVKLRLSFKEREVLKKLVYWHLRPGYLADQAPPSERAIYRFFRDTEGEGVGVIVLSLADWNATRGPLTNDKKRKRHQKVMLKLIDYYFEQKRKVPLPKIIDGYDIMRKFNIGQGPLVGKILKKVKEEQALGKVTTKQKAFELAERIIKNTTVRQ